ncbi:WD40-repeat-containing domain protein [Clohesyomyces aquaticus]|uniref:WD40-repeat-containing domain protein n=1 Tax=Clohesyomyces aquaticus TaxID=1231657 RepID=A0A1Y2A0U2_9PLEO|nr:WD40-repeat-containing domain protein [Clohesyomyces aquaticus]
MAADSFAQNAAAPHYASQPRSRIRLDEDTSRGVVTDICSTADYIVVTLDNEKTHVFDGEGHERMILYAHATVWSTAIWEETLVTGAVGGDIRVWNLESGQKLQKLTGHTATVRQIKMLDANTAVSSSREGSLRIWDLAQGTCKQILEGHTGTVRALAVVGDIIVSASYDTTVRLWSIAQGSCLHILHGHNDAVYHVVFDGKRIATGSADKSIRIWDPTTGACIAVLQAHEALVSQLDLQNGILTSAASDGSICAWHLDGAEGSISVIYKIPGHANSVTSLQVRDGKIYSGSSDGDVKVWNAQDGTLVGQIGSTANAIWRVVSRSNKVVVLASRNNECLMEIWDYAQERSCNPT